MFQFRISLFEKFLVNREGDKYNCFRSQKAQELFCYLLIHHDHIHQRGKLADQLWGEMKMENTRAYLRKSLWQLQASLNSISEHLAGKMLRVDTECLELNLHPCCWLDVAQFEETYKLVDGLRGGDLENGQYIALKTAVDLYKDELLIGWFQDWCIFERERLKEMLLIMINKLMDYCETNGDFETSIGYGHKLLGFEPAHERTHRRVMRNYYLAGYRTDAIRQYEKCKKALKEELSVDPSKQTNELCDEIKNDREEILLQGGKNRPTLVSNSSVLLSIEVLSRIKKHLARQAYNQNKLFEEVQLLENSLRKRA